MPRKTNRNPLRQIALAFPDVEQGIACKGTAVECATFKVRDKAFLFVGKADIRVKLCESLPEAVTLAAKDPGRYHAGATGWVKVTFSDDQPLLFEILERWIGESYRLMTPNHAVATSPLKRKPTSKRRRGKKKQ